MEAVSGLPTNDVPLPRRNLSAESMAVIQALRESGGG